ncbi:MAG TPA: SagB/ThcOx family dehydrogenase [Vicinamibacterales bacterium]|nr:SagB/ThcOx family dehydrogenase [Vicinamibacterales bacterium]
MSHSRTAPACVLIALLACPCAVMAQAAAEGTIKLIEPAKKGGLTVMEAFSARASVRSWSIRDLSMRDLSDLLWAANGVNRPDGKRTAASAINAQDVDLYVVMKGGAYQYDAANHALTLVASGDHRSELGVPEAPVHLFLVSDGARFSRGAPEQKHEWGAIDSGIVSQNVGLFCAGRGLATRPRASFDRDKLRSLLKLKGPQHAFLNHPVGYPVDAR